MLEHTFVHVPGVGETTERRLWDNGVLRWANALERTQPPERFSTGRWCLVQRIIEESARALERGDHTPFAQGLKSSHHWRAWPSFRSRTAYLDIETTGLGHADSVTVVGLYDGARTSTFIAGENLDELPAALERYALLVTFNGASFDLPMLTRCFRGLCFRQLHVDLMHPLRRLGLRGGLKSVERQLNLPRDPEIQHLDGWDAVRLWHEWRRGSARSLDLLVRYNTADIENLELLMQHVYEQMRAAAHLPDRAGECAEVE